LGIGFEEVIDLIGREDSGQEPADHHRNRAFFDEGLEYFTEHRFLGVG